MQTANPAQVSAFAGPAASNRPNPGSMQAKTRSVGIMFSPKKFVS